MEIRQLLTFKKVVEAGGITAAASQLGYAQSTVTLHIQEIETELNVMLFDRIGKRLLLTDAGRELYDYMRDLSQIITRIRYIGTETFQQRGNLRIAVPPALMDYLLCDFFAAFFREAPLVNIQAVNYHNTQKLYELLCEGTVDFAFLSGSWSRSHDMVVEPLLHVDHVVVAGPEMDLSSINLSEADRPLGTRLILNHPSAISHMELAKYLDERNIRPSGTMEVWGIQAIKKLVKDNLGIAFLPEFVVAQEIKNREMVQVATEHVFPQYSVCLAYLRNKWESPLFQTFREMLLEFFRNRSKRP